MAKNVKMNAKADWEIIDSAVTEIGFLLGSDPASEAIRDYLWRGKDPKGRKLDPHAKFSCHWPTRRLRVGADQDRRGKCQRGNAGRTRSRGRDHPGRIQEIGLPDGFSQQPGVPPSSFLCRSRENHSKHLRPSLALASRAASLVRFGDGLAARI